MPSQVSHPHMSKFQQVLEAVETLSLDDQAMLLDIVQKRLHEQQRHRISQEVSEIRREYQDGDVTFGTVDEFLAELDDA